MSELIFELGCEEIPARFVPAALAHLQSKIEELTQDARLDIDGIRTLGTPRRLTVVIDHVADTQHDLEEERLGPPERAAYRDGQPTKAAEGFARGQGVAVEDLYVVETPKGRYIAAKVFEKGAPASSVLPGLLQAALDSLSFPKSMRWANYTPNFARPVRWIVALYGSETLPVTIANVQSGAHTRGHRFSSPGQIEVTSITQYIDALRQADVIVDPKERASIMHEELARCAQESGGTLREDDALAEEVLFLVEKPHGVLVTFDQEYLKLPDEVLISSMRKHQRYFGIKRPDGSLLNACAVIYNTPVHDPDVVRAGNLRVLKARLDDAKFFWEQDAQSSLEDLAQRLDEVIWLKKLGTLKQRALRMKALSKSLATLLDLAPLSDTASRAAFLAKSDLLTNMVAEFPDLQGVVGREYAKRDRLGDEIAQAIHEQYMPKGADDDTPSSDAGAIVALAERLDTLVGLFAIGLNKSGADPYGLRRAAAGILRILQDRAWSTPLRPLIQASLDTYLSTTDGLEDHSEALKASPQELVTQLTEFFQARFKSSLTGTFGADVVDSVLAVTEDEVLTVRDRVEALHTLRQDADFEPLAVGFKRVVNILRRQADDHVEIPAQVKDATLVDDQEKALWAKCNDIRPMVEDAVQTRNWLGACRALITLKTPIDDFFDHVMVMTDDESLKLNRLALLDQIRALFLQVADISKITT